MWIHETIVREISRSIDGVRKEAWTSAAKGWKRRELYSELRTVYETTAADPHTIRLTFKLKDMIDGRLLREAVDKTMARYPYFQVRLIADGKDDLFFEYNPTPVPVLNTDERTILGSEQTSGHLLSVSYWHNRLHIDVYHGLTDGGGIGPFLKTLLYYYCSFYYGADFSREGIRLSGESVPQAEWDDPARLPLGTRHHGLIHKWDRPALQLLDAGIAHPVPDSVVYNMRIPEKDFMRFNFSNDGSPAAIVALLLARAIDALHPNTKEPPVIAMCVNQRRALGAPLAHQSLVGDVRLPYTGRLKALPFTLQATCFRGMVTLQSDKEMVLDEIRDYQALMAHLEGLDGHRARQDCCVHRMESLSRCITATVSYVGKSSLGDAEFYIHDHNALPSTALPSTHVPLTIELSAINGYFFLNFMQFFHEDDYFSAFVSQLRENNIDYDVLDLMDANYPRVELPF